jgi:predicted RNase H-like HicB family nuclease
MKTGISKNKNTVLVNGIVVECKSGRYLAYYEHRTDIIANGENEAEVKKNLKEMYEAILKYEEDEELEKNQNFSLPKEFKTRPFKENIVIA